MNKKTVYAFIDSQNLNLGTSKNVTRGGKVIYKGWKLDFKKFRTYLADKFRVDKPFLFIGYMKENEKLYTFLKESGYVLIFKPTTVDKEGVAKGNVDAELVLHAAAIEYQNFDTAVIVSGDGDFKCLYDFLREYKKMGSIIIPNRLTQSSLLKEYEKEKVFLNREREKLKYEGKADKDKTKPSTTS